MRSRTDAARAIALAVLAAVYCWSLPFIIGDADEAKELYQALRLLQGARFFVDVYDLIPPGLHYILAGAYALFGASIGTARAVDAAIHGGIVAMTFLIARRLGAGTWLATIAAVADVGVFRASWPVTSPHWASTLVLLAATAALVEAIPGGALIAGLVIGVGATIQQQRAAMVGVGAVSALVARHVLLFGVANVGLLVRHCVRLAVGVLVVVVPFAAFLLVRSGVDPVFQALVMQPLMNYREHIAREAWGDPRWSHAQSVPWVAAWGIPLVVVGLVVWTVVRWNRRGDRTIQRVVVTSMALAAIASVAYAANAIHLSFVAPLFAAVGGALLSQVPRQPLVTAVVGGLVVVQLVRVQIGMRAEAPYELATPFGAMRFRTQAMVDEVSAVQRAVNAQGAREMFAYPGAAAWYLWTGTTNPTPYQFLMPGYLDADRLGDVIETLEERRVPFVAFWGRFPNDLVAAYFDAHYEAIADQPMPVLWRRKGLEAPAP